MLNRAKARLRRKFVDSSIGFSFGFSIGFSNKIALEPPTSNFALKFSTLSPTMNQTKKLKKL